ncbi:hypothetical protein FJZ21_01820 [Candidatus Pacearchaeota archaeon]|nr:hypothetical protein [Candidatus Pacearchaeota archaeon]
MIQKEEIFPRVPLYYSVPMLVICIVALLILILTFRVEFPVLLLQPVPSNAINVSSCGVLSQNNSYYVLNQSLSVGGDCLIINGNNITLDGLNSYWIANPSNIGIRFTAVNITGNDVTVKNLNITSNNFSVLLNGIISSGNRSFVYNNYINSSTNTGISFNNTFNSVAYRNILNPKYGSGADSNLGIYVFQSFGANISENIIVNVSLNGISLSLSNNSLVYNNFITYLSNPSQSGQGVGLQASYNSFISLNKINGLNYSILLSSSDNNSISLNEINNSFSDGVYSILSNNNKFVGNKILNPSRNGISFITSGIVQYSYYLENNSVSNGTIGYHSLNVNPPFFSSQGLAYLSIKDNYFESYRLNNTYLIFANKDGLINFTSIFGNVIGNNLSDHMILSNNFAEVKSNLNLGLNKSAVVTFYGLPNNIFNATVYRDGFPCPSTICTNVTVDLGIATFNVTGWTNYSINWTGQVSTQPQPSAQTMSINEPDPNEQYTTASFPVTFRVGLSTLNGSVRFSFNNGLTNTTMNTTDGLQFNYDQDLIPVGNYIFTAFANFTNGTRLKGSVNFSVINTTGSSTARSSGGSNSGGSSSSGSSSGGTTTAGTSTGNGTTAGTTTSIGTTSGTGTPQTLPGTQSNSMALRSMIFWILIAVLSIMIIILSVLIFKAIKRRRIALASNLTNSPVNTGGLISNLK